MRPELEPVHQAISVMLDHHDPYPGIAFNRHWDITSSNEGAKLMLSFASSDSKPNLLDILINIAGMGLIEKLGRGRNTDPDAAAHGNIGTGRR